MADINKLLQEIAGLKAELASLRKTNDVLINRVERSVDNTGSAYSMFETNVLLQNRINERTFELQESHNRLRLVLDSLEAAVYVADINTYEVLFANKYIKNIVGDIEGKVCWKVCWKTPPSAHTGVCCFCTKDKLMTPEGKPGGLNVWDFQSPVTKRWYHIQDRAIQWVDGRIARIEIATDITERKKAEEELRKLSRAVEYSPVTIVITDTEGRIEYVNPKFVETTGYSVEEAVGQNPKVLKSGAHPPAFYNVLWDTILDGRVWHGEFCNRRRNGELYWEAAAIAPVRNVHGEITHFVAIKEDITGRKYLEVELRNAKDAAEAANLAKGEFLATMSHEIRTPMNSIIGMTDLAIEMASSDTQAGYLSMVKQSSELLLTIINDILDFSKIEAGKIELEAVDFRIEDIVMNSIEMFSLQAAQKGLKIGYSIASGVPQAVKGDPIRLRQILINLLSNAMKFTENGEIHVEVTMANEETASPVSLLFSVRDTGIGIPENKKERIFQSFVQADSSTTRKYGGTGLGLTICLKLVELMGGKIQMESRPGKGSKFFFTAGFGHGDLGTALKGEEESSLILPAAIVKPLNILLVEDNLFNQLLAVKLIEKQRHAVTVANNGREALDVLERQKFDLVLMDVQMPEMDGYEAARLIRSSSSRVLNPKVPIIAMTANAMPGDREKCLEAGMNDYISKPLRINELGSAISRQASGDVHQERAGSIETSGKISINKAKAMDLLAGNEELYIQVCKWFMEFIPDNVRQLEEAIDNGDIDSIMLQAHSLKSGAGSIGSDKLMNIASELEQSVKDKNMVKTKEIYIVFRQEFEKTIKYLAAIYNK